MANPVTLAEVQQHLRLGTLDTAEQTEINTMIDAATEHRKHSAIVASAQEQRPSSMTSFHRLMLLLWYSLPTRKA